MRCPGCDGKGFLEYDYGLVQRRCPKCKGTGEIEMEDYPEAKEGDVLTQEMVDKALETSGTPPKRLTTSDIEALSQDTYIHLEGETDAAVDSGTVQSDKPLRSAAARKSPRARKRQKSRQA